MGRERVLIVGCSTRALAESALASGWDCSSVDAFGDLDQKARVTNVGVVRDLGRPYAAATAVAAARRIEARSVAYVGNLENHPAAVARLARERELLGNSPASLEASRDFAQLRSVVKRAGGRVPLTLGAEASRPRGRVFLRKPRRGGGGQGVRVLPAGARLGTLELAQERIDGEPGSVSFLADGREVRLLGVARGLAGDGAFGATGYRYCGSLFPLAIETRTRERLDAVARAATRAFGLVGLNGIDFVLHDGEPFVLELNPRHSASMELIERAFVSGLFGLHAAACRGSLPEALPPLRPGVWGKAVLWARQHVVAPRTRAWLERDDVRDLPFPGERIQRGHPICTVLAHAADERRCLAALAEAAAGIERQLSPARSLVRA